MAPDTSPVDLERSASPLSEFRCAACGYGVSVQATPDECPMCRGSLWEPAPWRPFTGLSDGFGQAA